MNRLMLLRHAKAAWAQPGTRDFDRPLDEIGRRQTIEVGDAIVAAGLLPDHVVCSTARRARETWEGASARLGDPRPNVHYDDRLYSGDAVSYLEIARDAAVSGTVLIVGHNPMIEDLAHLFSGHGDKAARAALAAGFPPGALATISFSGEIDQPHAGRFELVGFLTPGGR